MGRGHNPAHPVNLMQGVDHYENFPVASWLCPPALRPPIVAIYRFARTADDLADEGNAPAPQRLAALQAYRAELGRACAAPLPPPHGRWPEVFGPLAVQIQRHALPAQWLHALLDAFEQDVRYTAEGLRYPDMAALLDYCSRSANPVGRLLLHLYGVNDPAAWRQSDAICSALQLINFWQDLRIDLSRQRHYLPTECLHRHGVDEATLQAGRPCPPAEAMVLELSAHARALMRQGAPLARRLPGRVGWELRLVVQGGLRILDKIDSLDGRTWQQRPRLTAADVPLLLWRAWRRPAALPPSQAHTDETRS